MDIKKASWARALALFLALTMIMMYSVSINSYASINDVKVHYDGFVETGDTIVVRVSIGGITYTASCTYDSGKNYTGAFDQDFPLEKGDKIPIDDTIVTIEHEGNIVKILAVEKDSAVGNKSTNIFVYDPEAEPEFDLEIDKVAEESPIALGEIAEFTVSVTNNSETTAEGVFVEDMWPDGLPFGGASESVSVDGDMITWDIGDMDPGEILELTLTGTGITIGGFTNHATVSFGGIDSDLSDNEAEATVEVSSEPQEQEFDLSIVKTVDNDHVTIGDMVSFMITITNSQESDVSVSGIYAEDMWPEGLEITNVEAEAETNYSTESGIWSIGTLEIGESKMLTITALTTTLGSFTNEIEIGVDIPAGDSNGENDSSSATVMVGPVIEELYDLGITKTIDEQSALLGESVTFTITITNSNESSISVSGIYADDLWPEGLSISSITAEPETSFDSEYGRWEIGTLDIGESKTLTITAVTTTLGLLTNTIDIGSDRPSGDVNTENDSASATVRVYEEYIPFYDIGLTKTANPDSMYIGTNVVFTITVTNHGNVTVSSVFVQDMWPTGLTQENINPAEGTTYDAIENIWEVGNLDPGVSKILTIEADTTAIGTFTNTVERWGEFRPDENQDNDLGSATINVRRRSSGGGTTTTTTVIPEPDVPLVEQPEVPVVPIIEEPIPLADVPQTGDINNILMLLGLLLGSGAGITALGRRKVAKDE